MYFGSVRFFKNLILLCVLVLILVPLALNVYQHHELASAQEQIVQLEAEVEQTRQQLDEVVQQAVEAEAMAAAAEVVEAVAQARFSAETPAYQELYPDFYAPQPLAEQSQESGVIYLTFDDGPTKNTDRILEVLAEKDVKATFFVTGHTDGASLERMREIVAQGHTLGMHSFMHDYAVIYDSVEAFLDDMYQVFVLIRETTGETPTVFRFPGGSINSYNSGIYQELMAEMLRRGFVPYDWNISAQDATSKPLAAEEIVENVFASAAGKERGIVLMHDGSSNESTAEALGTIIERFQEMGFRFDRIQPDTKPILFGYLE